MNQEELQRIQKFEVAVANAWADLFFASLSPAGVHVVANLLAIRSEDARMIIRQSVARQQIVKQPLIALPGNFKIGQKSH